MSADDKLLDLAAQLEPDGGMPGSTLSERAARTVAAVLAFASEGHTATAGPFRSHVARLVGFLKSIRGLAPEEQSIVERAIDAARNGAIPSGNWLTLASLAKPSWQKLERSLAKPSPA